MIELVILIAIKICDATQPYTVRGIVMYAAIAVNTVVAIYYYCRHGRRQRADLIAYALFVTAAADVFLTLIGTDALLLPGFALFCVVEIIYAVYLKSGWPSVIARAALYAVLLLAVGHMGMLTLPYAVGLFNIVLILVNVIQAWRSKKHCAPMHFRIGITLFLCCDMSILVRTLATGTLHDIIAWLVWIFYVPAQVLIVLAYVKEVLPDKKAESSAES